MATIALMIGGAVLNASAFIGGSYLAKALSPEGERLEEQKRHDLALEHYQQDMAAWQKKRQQYQGWLQEKYQNKLIADKNFQDTDAAFKHYAQATHINPTFNYGPSKQQKNNELLYVGVGGLVLGGAVAYYI